MKELDLEQKQYIAEKMLKQIEKLDQNRYSGGRKCKIYLSITIYELSKLFTLSEKKIRYLIEQKKFDPSNLESICNLYQLRKLK